MATTRDDARFQTDVLKDLDVEVDAAGRIIDYLDPTLRRNDKLEERVRQFFARLLVEEYGYPKSRIAFEVPINIGKDVKYADIGIFNSASAASKRDQGQLYLVVETKAPNISSGVGQLTSYIFSSSASGGVWFNGEVAYFRRILTPVHELRPWVNIPRYGEDWESIGNYRKDDLRAPTDLKRVFQRCHNAIYKSGMDSEDIALDMVRIILAKYKDEESPGDIGDFRCTPQEYSNPNGRREAALRVQNLFKRVVSTHRDVFPSHDKITIRDDSLCSVITELQGYRFLAKDDDEENYDIIGTAFEVYVSPHLKGDRGQFFTNRLVVNMMVQVMDPSEDDIIYDPSCGSGGFLIAALRYIRGKIKRSGGSSVAQNRKIFNLAQRLHGTDIAPRLVRVAKTNMILNGDGHGGMVRANALQDLDEQLPRDSPLRSDSPSYEAPTLILANPPFGASYELRERNIEILRNYELGHVHRADADGWQRATDSVNDAEGVPPEILFVEKCIRTVRVGGRVAIVLARGVLDNREAIAAREYVLRHCKVLGVVNCHPNTFAPFNGTKASILFLERKAEAGIQLGEDYPVFMAISQRIGQDSLGREIHKKNDAGETVQVNGVPVIDHDMAQIAEAWSLIRAGRASSYEAAWTVPVSRILGEPEKRMNPGRYAPVAERAVAQVLELAGSPEWTVERLGDIASVFNGPRFKRPFADPGVTSGDEILKMYTPKAFFEERGESAKYLDLSKANRVQKKQLGVLTLDTDWILIVDSGTAGKLLGKVGMTTPAHSGSIGNNNLIRVVVSDPVKRAYVYRFLISPLGQALLSRNVYGTNQDHIEPDDVKDIPIPLPSNPKMLKDIHRLVEEANIARAQAASKEAEVQVAFTKLLAGVVEAQSEMEEPIKH